MNIATNLDHAAFHFPDHRAVIEGDRSISYSEFRQDANRHYYRHVVGSVGTPVNLVEVQIRDLWGDLLGEGQEGEIYIRGPNVTKGYWNRPEETEAAFLGDWFRSGDIGVLDEDGYLYIVDRLKDMIITGGENVYPREVEEVLYTRPEVLECAVVGLPDYEYGEQVTALIVPREGHQTDPVAPKSYLKTQLAPFKVPKEYVATDGHHFRLLTARAIQCVGRKGPCLAAA